MAKLLVVSHPCVVPENQSVYLELRALGWDSVIVVPSRWRNEYRPDGFSPSALAGLEEQLVPIRVLLPGRQQRHIYLCRPPHLIRQLAPAAVFIEEEPYSLPAMQWGYAAALAGIPFGLQSTQNFDVRLPLPARLIRRWALTHASFIAARSPRAADLIRRSYTNGAVTVVPHAVPRWNKPSASAQDASPQGRPFTIGFAGRIVRQKGVLDLVQAAGMLDGPVRLLLVGDGPLHDEVIRSASADVEVEIRTGMQHDGMPQAYAEMDVLVLPSRTTPRWAEQFGRALVEALSCGVPIVGSTSGEIPWIVHSTGGGLLFDEGNVDQLAAALKALRDDPARRAQLGSTGGASVERLFSVRASAQALAGALT